MNITLGRGVDRLLFGFTEAQARELLGVEDKSYITGLGCLRLQFNTAMLELSFEPVNNNRLGWIEVHNPLATLFGHQLIKKTKQTVLATLISELGQPSEYEDYGDFDTAFNEDKWLELHFQFGHLQNINIGVCYGENEQPLWPNA